MPVKLSSNVFYKFSCSRCNCIYFEKTSRQMNMKIGRHSSISTLTEKYRKPKKLLLLKIIRFFFYHVVSLKDFKILANRDSGFLLDQRLKKVYWYQVKDLFYEEIKSFTFLFIGETSSYLNTFEFEVMVIKYFKQIFISS